MRHCVGSYFDKEDTTMYSLRDSKNNPHFLSKDELLTLNKLAET